MRVILHIGTEKTGTTSIQSSLASERQALLDLGILPIYALLLDGVLNNIELPLAARENLGGGLEQYRTIGFNQFRSEVTNRLEETIFKAGIAGINQCVISCEFLSSRLTREVDIRSLKNLFPSDADFVIVCYVRPQDQLFLSAQSEWIKAGGSTIEIYSPSKDSVDTPYGIIYYDYSLMLQNWSRVFGVDKVVVRPYQRNELSKGDVVVDFFNFLGCGKIDTGEKNVAGINKSFPPELLYFLARINNLLDDSSRKKILGLMRQIENCFEPGSLISLEKLDQFYREFDESNREVAQRYLGRECLFPEETTPRRFIDCTNKEYLLEKSYEIFARLLSKLP